MSTKNFDIKNKIINKVFKLLPLREEKGDYLEEINSLIKEVKAMRKVEDSDLFFSTQYKLELLKETENFKNYRKLIFEIIGDIKGGK